LAKYKLSGTAETCSFTTHLSHLFACFVQALGMLFWHKHNFEKALADLPNFTPFPDEWTVEDKVLFEQAFNFHGKSFHRIRQMVGLTVRNAFVTRNTVARSSTV